MDNGTIVIEQSFGNIRQLGRGCGPFLMMITMAMTIIVILIMAYVGYRARLSGLAVVPAEGRGEGYHNNDDPTRQPPCPACVINTRTTRGS